MEKLRQFFKITEIKNINFKFSNTKIKLSQHERLIAYFMSLI